MSAVEHKKLRAKEKAKPKPRCWEAIYEEHTNAKYQAVLPSVGPSLVKTAIVSAQARKMITP